MSDYPEGSCPVDAEDFEELISVLTNVAKSLENIERIMTEHNRATQSIGEALWSIGSRMP